MKTLPTLTGGANVGTTASVHDILEVLHVCFDCFL